VRRYADGRELLTVTVRAFAARARHFSGAKHIRLACPTA
jgi:hypothetical protein